MTINVYVSREDGHPTKEDTALIKRTKKLVTGLAKEMGLTQSFDVVFFYDSIWLRNFPATKIAAYVSVAKSSKGKRPGLFLRKKYFDETGYEANRLTQVISHELLHMKVGPEKMHGSSFRKAAKEHGITPGATTKVSEMVYKKLTTNQPPQGTMKTRQWIETYAPMFGLHLKKKGATWQLKKGHEVVFQARTLDEVQRMLLRRIEQHIGDKTIIRR